MTMHYSTVGTDLTIPYCRLRLFPIKKKMLPKASWWLPTSEPAKKAPFWHGAGEPLGLHQGQNPSHSFPSCPSLLRWEGKVRRPHKAEDWCSAPGVTPELALLGGSLAGAQCMSHVSSGSRVRALPGAGTTQEWLCDGADQTEPEDSGFMSTGLFPFSLNV